MAIRHGVAGQYGKTEAAKRSRRIVDILILLGTLGILLYGFIWGYFWARVGPLFALLPIFALFGLFILVWRPVERYIDRLALERIKFMRGGQGEALVGWLLESLDDTWHIFNGVKLEADSDIDHILVGPGGIYCISTKSHRGVFAGTASGLLHNGQPSDFARQALRQTMDIKDRLVVLLGKDVPWVRSVLAVPFGYTMDDGCDGKVWLVHQEDLIRRLAPEKGPKKLNHQQVARTVKVLKMLQDGAAEVYVRLENLASPRSPTV